VLPFFFPPISAQKTEKHFFLLKRTSTCVTHTKHRVNFCGGIYLFLMCEGKDFLLLIKFSITHSHTKLSAVFELHQISIFGGKGLKFCEAKRVGFLLVAPDFIVCEAVEVVENGHHRPSSPECYCFFFVCLFLFVCFFSSDANMEGLFPQAGIEGDVGTTVRHSQWCLHGEYVPPRGMLPFLRCDPTHSVTYRGTVQSCVR
jgi:hypothetical protein